MVRIVFGMIRHFLCILDHCVSNISLGGGFTPFLKCKPPGEFTLFFRILLAESGGFTPGRFCRSILYFLKRYIASVAERCVSNVVPRGNGNATMRDIVNTEPSGGGKATVEGCLRQSSGAVH